MHGKAGHLVGVLVGVIAAPVLGYLILESATDLQRIAMFDNSPPGFRPMSTAGSATAAVFLVAAAVIAGLLAGTWRMSPLAPLVAGLLLVALGLYGQFDYIGTLMLLSHLPVSVFPASDELVRSGMWQVLGGTLLVSAAWPARWTGRPGASFRPSRGALGIVLGVAALPALWYLIQLANPVGYVTVALAAHSPRVYHLILVPQLMAAAVIGTLAATRWVSPDTPGIAGLPLLVIGLLLVLVPVDAAQWIAPFVWSSRPIALGFGQSISLGAFLLFGGLLVTSAVLPRRWRQPPPSTAPEPGAAAAVSETA
jgi:hypothetical protein